MRWCAVRKWKRSFVSSASTKPGEEPRRLFGLLRLRAVLAPFFCDFPLCPFFRSTDFDGRALQRLEIHLAIGAVHERKLARQSFA